MKRCFRYEHERGLTLLELLIVVAIMAAIGGSAVILTMGTEDAVARDLVEAEIRSLKEAILQFKKDTGFLPRTGPFDLVGPAQGKTAVPSQGAKWFYSPANFIQLIEEPIDPSGRSILPWNRDTGRGWRGPYLQRTDGWVEVGGGLAPSGIGSPAAGSVLERVRGVADPFLRDPEGPFFVWRFMDADGSAMKRRGRPFYLFDEHERYWARLVSAGPNGVYESQEYAMHHDEVSSGDDIVIFLFR